MISPFDIDVWEEYKSNKKYVCELCKGCICCEQPPGISLKRNHIRYKMICRSQYSVQFLTNKNHSDVSDIEKNQRRLNKKKCSMGKIELY